MRDEAEIKGYIRVNELIEKMDSDLIFNVGRLVFIPKTFFPKSQLPSGHAKMMGYAPHLVPYLAPRLAPRLAPSPRALAPRALASRPRPPQPDDPHAKCAVV